MIPDEKWPSMQESNEANERCINLSTYREKGDLVELCTVIKWERCLLK